MRKSIAVAMFVAVLLIITAGVVVAVWEDTQSTQVTTVVLPLPGGTFYFSSPGYCQSAVIGFEDLCGINIINDSSTIMSVDAVTITTGYPDVTTRVPSGVIGADLDPGEAWTIHWYYLMDPAGQPGEVTFDVEVTCSGE